MPDANSAQILRRSILAAGAALFPSAVWAAAPTPLRVKVMATGESLAIPLFTQAGRRDERMPLVLDWLTRDWRAGQWTRMDRRLYDLVYVLSRVSGAGEIEIVSGFRSPATNAMLAARSEAVAIRSLHLEGRALDFRIPGLDNAHVARIAWRLNFGGVGLYGSDFVHVDTGNRRRWGDDF